MGPYIKFIALSGIIAVGLSALSSVAQAQTSPVDLADLTLAELLEIEVVAVLDHNGSQATRASRRWHFEYRYTGVKFKGYRDGTHRISTRSLLGSPPGPRTFAVLPVKIIQQAHLFHVSYDVFDNTRVGLILPVLTQRTNHISVVPTYEKFSISSSGIGDVSLLVSQRLWKRNADTLRVNMGLSFPTGSINQKGDTPRDTGLAKEQLPFTMQLGSGTYDLIVGLKYGGRTAPLALLPWLGPPGWGAQVVGKIRTGKNSRDYRLGNLVLISAWLSATPLRWLEPSLRIRTQIWGRIHGVDTSTELAPGVFPAPVTNPDLFGGEKISLIGGVKLTAPAGMLPGTWNDIFGGTSVKIEAGAPVYQSLNGPQPEEDIRVSISLDLAR